MPRNKKPQTWGRRAKSPQPSPWMRTSQGYRDRCNAAKSAKEDERDLDAKLEQVLGRASYVDDLLEECGFGRR